MGYPIYSYVALYLIRHKLLSWKYALLVECPEGHGHDKGDTWTRFFFYFD